MPRWVEDEDGVLPLGPRRRDDRVLDPSFFLIRRTITTSRWPSSALMVTRKGIRAAWSSAAMRRLSRPPARARFTGSWAPRRTGRCPRGVVHRRIGPALVCTVLPDTPLRPARCAASRLLDRLAQPMGAGVAGPVVVSRETEPDWYLLTRWLLRLYLLPAGKRHRTTALVSRETEPDWTSAEALAAAILPPVRTDAASHDSAGFT